MKVRFFESSAILLAILIGFSSCKAPEENPVLEKIQLDVPNPTFVDAGSTWATLTWPAVKGAISYNIWFDGDDKPDISIDTIFTITNLTQNTAYSVTVTAEAATQGNYTSSKKSAAVTFKTSSKPTLEAPLIVIDTVTSTAFEARWKMVEMAENYTYVFENEDEVTTTDTTVVFNELSPGHTYTLRVKASPTEEYAEDYDPSMWSTLKVTTSVPDTLKAPVVTVERASCIHATISWDEVPLATGYRYTFGDSDTVSTTALSTYFEGLVQDSTYTFHIQAICDDPNVAMNSSWSSVSFKAVDDFETTLHISAASATDTSATFTAALTKDGETFAMGILPKAKWIDSEDASKIDTAAIITMISGSSPTLYSSTTTKTYDNLYQGTTYICYALSIDKAGNVKSALQATDVKVEEFAAKTVGANYNTGGFAKVITYHGYGYSTSAGLYGPTNYFGFKISNETTSTKTLSEVKYTLWTASAFESKFGGTTVATAESVKNYFDTGGSTMSSTNLSKVNSGTAYSAGYTGRTANTAYTIAMRAVTSDGDTLVCVSTLLNYKEGTDWLHFSVDQSSGAKITITSDMPISEGKYSMVKLSSSNNTPELVRNYNVSNSLSAANISDINAGSGVTKSYTSLTSSTTYNFILRVKNVAGDEVTRNILIRTN